MMWLEIIEPSGFRVLRLEVPVTGEEWQHEIKEPTSILPKIIRLVENEEESAQWRSTVERGVDEALTL